jgi:hypothetical protein
VSDLFAGHGWTSCRAVSPLLAARHYLGPCGRGVAWHDEFGVIVVGPPTSRRLPRQWLELSRWCITSRVLNAGSRQWRGFAAALRLAKPDVTTVVSYSDPSVGHTGALYRACNWWWAPTWHRLRPPPTGNGAWSDKAESVKDRWIFPLRADASRPGLLRLQDESVLRKYPWAAYREPGGVPFKQFQEAA